MTPQNYIYAGGAMFLLALTLSFYLYVSSLKSDLMESQLRNATLQAILSKEKLNSETLRGAITSQNYEIEKMATLNSKTQRELREWKSKPTDVKYKTIETIREIKSNECEQIKSNINSVRSIDYNSL